ncbi:hypothetical protein [uncultured Pseudoflavonifractor sp.]|uniref:XkdQ/YqbQ family protein n=1 Tax=uncultured Pseudoflavonifractor sp. TaxID=1221379 RepID=UPI0025DFAAFA|nr:hypothetical protein [uncultured Pseudoflavonifractor sp.]
MDYELLLTAPSGGETRDFAQLVQTMSWSGSVRQTARELSATLAVPRDGSVTPPALREGAYLTLRRAGETVFTGPLLTATTSSQDSLVDLSALDRGRFLVGNEGWYSFSGVTPETAAAAIARDYGIPVAALAAAGVSVSRKFPGVALDKIIRTLYGLAGEQNGKRYLVRFTGGGALEVVEKPTSASLSIASTMAVTNTWDITNLQNSVAIRTQEGALVRRVEDADSVALNGRLEHVITQRDGEDAGSEAQAWLEDNGLQQNLTVETLGDPRLITGEAVLLRDTGSGVSGLFWIDGDTHTWKNGQYYCKLTLNFRNLVDDTRAGSEL